MSTLYIIPTTISNLPLELALPKATLDIICSLDAFIVENPRTTRRSISKLPLKKPIQEIDFYSIRRKKDPYERNLALAELKKGRDIGLMSESGCPGVADPGSDIIFEAHKAGIKVVPLIGPSSIVLALMASGLNGQRFKFYGYLPRYQEERIKKIKKLETDAYSSKHTSIFIETPYRNHAMLKDLVDTLKEDTLLTVAQDITGENQIIKTLSVYDWRTTQWPKFSKAPTVFLLGKDS